MNLKISSNIITKCYYFFRNFSIILTPPYLSFCYLFFWEGSLCSTGSPGTYSVDQAGLELIDLPAFASASLPLPLPLGIKVLLSISFLSFILLSNSRILTSTVVHFFNFCYLFVHSLLVLFHFLILLKLLTDFSFLQSILWLCPIILIKHLLPENVPVVVPYKLLII